MRSLVSIAIFACLASGCSGARGPKPPVSSRPPSPEALPRPVSGADAPTVEVSPARRPVDPEAMAVALGVAPARPWSSAAAYRHFLEGSVALEDGAYGRAERELTEAVLHDPESAHLRISLARAQWHAGKREAALASARKSVVLDPSRGEAHRLLARLHRDQGQFREAEAALRRAIEVAPDDAVAYVDLAALLLEAGRVEDALLAYEALEERKTRLTAPWNRLGLALERGGHLSEARIAFVRAREAAPEDAGAAENEGRVCQALRERRCAVEAYNVALALAPDRFHLLLRVARLFGELDQGVDAREAEAQLVAGDPKSADILLQVALTAADRGELDLSLRRLRRARAMAPDRGDLLFFQGYVLEQQGEVEEALKVYGRGGADPARGSDALLARASLLSRLGRHGEALKQLTVLARRSPLGVEARTLKIEVLAHLGDSEGVARETRAIPVPLAHDIRTLAARSSAELTLGRPEEALRLLRAELRARPGDQNLQYLLATVLLRLERQPEAIALMEKVSAADPDRADAMNFLAYAWTEEGRELEKAEALARRALSLEPTNGYILDTLGWVLLARGRPQDAVVELQRAARLLPVDPEILEHLGDAWGRVGDFEKASRVYGRVLELPGLEQDLKIRVSAKLADLEAEGARSP